MSVSRKNQAGATDLTVGRPLTNILRFALPLVGGTLFQQLYSFADTVIVGRCLGTDALGAVGITYSLNFLIIGFIQGACIGFGIPLAEAYGAKDRAELSRYLANGALLSALLCAILTAGTLLFAKPLLLLIHTPDELLSDALLYIRIIFLGIPTTMLYNYASNVLRAVGDSKHPFYFLLFASILNIVLDWVLVVPFGMGVDGAAIATVFSQAVSGVLCAFWFFLRTAKQLSLPFSRGMRSFSAPHFARMAYIGLPMGFECSVSAIGAVVMQDAINLLGSTAVAAQTAGEKIRQMFTLPMESVGMAMATYVGQNHGAGRNDRIRQGLFSGCLIQLVYCVLAWIVIFLCKYAAVGLVLGTDADPAVTDGAVRYLSVISLLFCFHGLLMIFRNTLQGLGRSIPAVLSGVGELAGRSFGGWLAVTRLGYLGICLSNPFAWMFALLYCTAAVVRTLRREAAAQNG